jgi:phage FluMu gp28-like protein
MILDPYYVQPLTARQRAVSAAALLSFRQYQEPVFWSNFGILILHWSRQVGKSHTLAAWAVHRLLAHPGRLVTVLSNSAANGMEFLVKVAYVCDLLRVSCENVDLSRDGRIENMRMEVRIKVCGKIGRIIVLAANPRTARGFSGDLILDEFAFHEDGEAIWDAVEPIISSNPDYLCRIASTGNGRFNMFYRMANETSPSTVSRIRRSEAWRMGLKIYDPASRREMTPDDARAAALDKASYDQNYECAFNDENMSLLTNALIAACEYPADAGGNDGTAECRICRQDWSYDALEFLRGCRGPLGIGLDVGRTRDITVITVGEKLGGVLLTRAILRISGMRLPEQLERLKPVLRMPNFGRLCGDATGLGLGLVEFAQEECGAYRAEAVQFSSRERRTVRGVRQSDSALVTELMALDLLEVFENGAIRIPCELALRESLRKPERITTAGGVRIAATRDEAGHADEFWSVALMVRALKGGASHFAYDEPEEPRAANLEGVDGKSISL